MTSLAIVSPVSHLTLDEVWAEAETIGDVSLEGGRYGGDPYQSRISFMNGASRVFAYGKGRTLVAALIGAIEEARRVGGRR